MDSSSEPPVFNMLPMAPRTGHRPINLDSVNLLDECWVRVMSFLSAGELCRCAGLGSKCRALANNDELWRHLCRVRWADKQYMPDELFRNGDYRLVSLTVPECKSLLARRGIDFSNIFEKSELLAQLHSSNPAVFHRQPLPIPGKWKTSYAFAEADSHRGKITLDEIAHFRWHLIYNGRPSRMGLRHFQRNGVFVSPHLGQTSWRLDEQGNFVMHGVQPLAVQRNRADWGWAIGVGTNTEYHSREV